MDNNYIDEIALLKAFIDYKTLSYTEMQEKGIVPVLDKQDRRALFKNSIDKFKKWDLIEPIPDSDPRAWTVILDKATIEYNKLMKDIEQKQMVEKYSFQHLQDEVKSNSKKLKRIKLYKTLAISGFIIGAFNFITGLSLSGLFTALKHLFHTIIAHTHL
jgi:hypothetical protein